jgi:hypothetical protein
MEIRNTSTEGNQAFHRGHDAKTRVTASSKETESISIFSFERQEAPVASEVMQ